MIYRRAVLSVSTALFGGNNFLGETATFELQNKVFVYSVVDGKTRQTEIEVAPLDDGKTYIVESGLKEGDTIIAEGAGLLKEGLSIEH